jgi:flagellar biosynthesis/type III secretory pathway protein FliH
MYDISLKMYSDYDNTIAYAEKQGLKRGIGMGIEQGIGMGIKQGINMGIEQGVGIGRQEAWNEADTIIAALKAEIEHLKKQ